MTKMGRPLIPINWEQFDKLCAIHCTLVEIAEWFNCSEDTIERAVKREYDLTFAEHYKRKSSKGKSSLRRMMWEKCQHGNVTMMIWLSKQVLGYSDKVEQAVDLTVEKEMTPEERRAELKRLDEQLGVCGPDSILPERTGA